VKASKLLLLLAILAFGGAIESAYRVRENIDVGPAGCRVLGGKFYGPSHSFESEERLELSPAARLALENAFGTVTVGPGAEGQAHVTLRTVVFLPTEAAAREFNSKVRLQVRREGDRITVGTSRAELGPSDVGFETHLVVAVPASSAVKVTNEHGAVDVGGVATADVENAYADVSLARITGDATLASRHGDVEVQDVKGAVTLSQRHGDVVIRDITGSLRLEAQHAEVRGERVGGVSAQLQYGNLKLEGVRGELEVTGEHAGVEANEIAGKARVQTSYRTVSVARVTGEARLSTSHGQVTAEDVAGALVAESSYDDVSVAGIKGPVQVKVDHGAVSARGLGQGGRIESSGDDVDVDGFAGALEIDARRGNVRLAPGAPLSGSLTARAANGGIELEVPPGSRFALEATARDGEVHVDLEDAKAQAASAGLFRGSIGAGGTAVTLAAEHGDVTVRLAKARTSADN
jgi:DUF4097 and DUF4098 domain-containing protein YvlB